MLKKYSKNIHKGLDTINILYIFVMCIKLIY